MSSAVNTELELIRELQENAHATLPLILEPSVKYLTYWGNAIVEGYRGSFRRFRVFDSDGCSRRRT